MSVNRLSNHTKYRAWASELPKPVATTRWGRFCGCAARAASGEAAQTSKSAGMDSKRPRRRAAPRSGQLTNGDGIPEAYAGNLRNAMRGRAFLSEIE